MAPTRQELQRWLDRFDAVELVDREARRNLPADPGWAVAVALSLIEAARSSRPARQQWAERDDDQPARRAWAALRARQRR